MRKKKKTKPAGKRRKAAKKIIRKPKKKKPAAARRAKPAGTVPVQKVVYTPPTGTTGLPETLLGEVDDYFAHVEVIALVLKDSLSVGDQIHVHGHTTDLTQKVESMQIEHQSVQNGKKGDSIGIKVSDHCRKGDKVYRVG